MERNRAERFQKTWLREIAKRQTGVDERGENERQSENDYEMKAVSYIKGPDVTR